MAYVSKKSAVIYVNEETTEGTPVNPSAGSDAVGVLQDNFELNPEKELVSRSLLRSGIQTQVPLTGIKTANGTIGVEAAANTTSGDAPDFDLLMKSALGGKRQSTSQVTSSTGHSTTVINIADGDIGNFAVGDIIMVREAGAFHLSPISDVDTTPAAANITLLVAGGSAFSDAVVIEKFTTYYGANSGHSSLTVTNFFEDTNKIQAAGCKVSSVALESFETGQLASFVFAMAGLSYTETLAASGLTASTSNATPPIVLEACLYVDGVEIPVNNFAFSTESTLGRIQSTCSSNGIIGQLHTERTTTGSFNPYMDTTSTDFFDKFDANTQFSLFVRAYNPTGTTGEFKQAWGAFIPKVIITEMPKSDTDLIMQYDISWQAGEDETGTYPSDIYLSFI